MIIIKNYLFIDQDIAVLRNEIKSSKAFFFKRLFDQCCLYKEEKLPEEHPAASTTFMGLASANLSLAYLLTKEEHYLEEAKRWIFTCVNYENWGNAHLVNVDLSAAWLLFGLSLSYDWLKDQLTEDERKQLREKLILQGKYMYDFKVQTEGSGWSTNYWQNHNWINLTGLAAAGYALGDEYADSEAWTKCAKDNFDYVYSVLPEDGSDYEGVVYWRYGAMWLFVYAHLIKEREGINYFETCSFLKNTFYYRLYQSAPNLEEQINFGDCHDRRSGHSTAIYYKVAKEYKNGYAQKLGNLVTHEFLYREAYESKVKPGILPECFFELLFYDPTVEETEFDTLPLVKYFEDLGLVVLRDSWAKDSLHFSFKCSTPGGKTQWKNLWKLKEEKNYNCFGLSHQHPDNNSFILHGDGTYWAIDDGYNRTVKASDHNTVIVDGKGYCDENQNNIWKDYTQDMIGDIEVFKQEDGYVYTVGETSAVYQKDLELNRFARHVLYTNKPYIIIRDDLQSEQPHIYSWLMHADVFPRSEGNYFDYDHGTKGMRVYNLSEGETSSHFEENIVRAVMTTQEPDKFKETRMKRLSVSNVTPAKTMNFLHVIVVGEENRQQYKVEKIDNETAFGVVVSKDEEREIFLSAKHGETITYNGRQYTGSNVLIRITGEKEESINLHE